MIDFLGNELAVGDTVIGNFVRSWGNDIFEYCTVVRFTEKAVIVNRLNMKTEKSKLKRVYAHHLIKVDSANYTMYILKKQKETA